MDERGGGWNGENEGKRSEGMIETCYNRAEPSE